MNYFKKISQQEPESRQIGEKNLQCMKLKLEVIIVMKGSPR